MGGDTSAEDDPNGYGYGIEGSASVDALKKSSGSSSQDEEDGRPSSVEGGAQDLRNGLTVTARTSGQGLTTPLLGSGDAHVVLPQENSQVTLLIAKALYRY